MTDLTLTATHEFRYPIGTILRLNIRDGSDTGYRYRIEEHGYRNGSFGYFMTSNIDGDFDSRRPVFHEVARVEPDWAYLEVHDD